jgi:guanine nucleotide-binding protein G(i) subunit alpha
MNKYDLFKEKIKRVPLKNFYDNFDGGDDLEKNKLFIEGLFREKNKFDKDRIFSYPSQNTDRKMFAEMFNTITKQVSDHLSKKKKN